MSSQKKAPGAWGVTGTAFIFQMHNRPVFLSLVDGSTLRGVLIGADPYMLVLRLPDGREVLVGKGNVVLLHADPAALEEVPQ